VDMGLFLLFARLLMPHFVGYLEEINAQFANEFDYRREAQLQREAAEHLRGLQGVVVPLPVDAQHAEAPGGAGLCTKRVLVMDRLRGASVADWACRALAAEAKARGRTPDELQAELIARPEELETQRPSQTMLAAYTATSYAATAVVNALILGYNCTVGLSTGYCEYSGMEVVPDPYYIKGRLLAAQELLLFQAGFVNGDPHAGNVMLLDDGQIGLIDWGQVWLCSLLDGFWERLGGVFQWPTATSPRPRGATGPWAPARRRTSTGPTAPTRRSGSAPCSTTSGRASAASSWPPRP